MHLHVNQNVRLIPRCSYKPTPTVLIIVFRTYTYWNTCTLSVYSWLVSYSGKCSHLYVYKPRYSECNDVGGIVYTNVLTV